MSTVRFVGASSCGFPVSNALSIVDAAAQGYEEDEEQRLINEGMFP
jgi:hypothetical protein